MRIHRIEILGQEYRFRLLTRRELREVTDSCYDDPVLFEDLVCEKCVTDYPPDFPGLDECLAGIPTTICKSIMDNSGYTGDKSVSAMEASAVEWAKTPSSRIVSLICFCMPSMTKDAVEDLDPEDFYYYAAMAQLIAKGLYGMDISRFLDPEADEAAAKPKNQSQRTTNLSPEQQQQMQQLRQMQEHAKSQGQSSYLI